LKRTLKSFDNHPLVGTWCSLEETLSVVEYNVSLHDGSLVVSATDSYDAEEGEINSTSWDEATQTLTFACYWASTGRYSKCKLLLFAEDKVEFTYTYTDHEILVRKLP
jgi:hypothetical protein